MEESEAEVLSKLEGVQLQISSVKCGVPCAATFTALKSTGELNTPHAAVSILEVFSLTKDILTGRSSSKVSKAVNRLIGVMRDHKRLSSMALGHLSHRAEKSQFWYTVTHVILPLAGQCSINKDLGWRVDR